MQNCFNGSIQGCIFATRTISSIELCFEDYGYETNDIFVSQVLMAFLVASHIVQHVDYLFLLTENRYVLANHTENIKILRKKETYE